jgi:putative endonuclease
LSAAKPLPHEQGYTAETLVADYFAGQGYRVVDRNYSSRRGEVDLIVERDQTVVFVEVRYRRSALFGSPEETITWEKRRRIVLAAIDYVTRHRVRGKNIRFDMVAVVQARGSPQIEHITGAFDADLGAGTTLLV